MTYKKFLGLVDLDPVVCNKNNIFDSLVEHKNKLVVSKGF